MRREREELIRAFVKTPMDKIYFMAITSHYEGSRMHSCSWAWSIVGTSCHVKDLIARVSNESSSES